MLSVQAEEAFSTLASSLVGHPELEEAVRDRWRVRVRGSATAQHDRKLPDALRAAADLLARELPLQTHAASDVTALAERFASPSGPLLLLWCYASTWRKDALLAGLLARARTVPGFEERVAAVAADRVIEGPLLDALGCVPLLGTGAALRLPANAEARARLEILIWEAGASAREVPAFGRWLWSSTDTFEELVRNPARGALRGRVLAARCLEISVCGLSAHADQQLVGRALQTLQPLLLHPEPLVWVHAARALGRLTGQVEQLEGTLLDWVLGESPLLRQRALTAFASLPADRLKFLASQLVAILESPSEVDWALAAVAAATPYLFFERRAIWDRLASRIIAGDGGAIAARALTRGLSALWRRGQKLPEIEAPLRALRELAWCAQPTSLDESRRWIEVTALTDAVDGAERDPLDLEFGLENLIRLAAQYDDDEADARAARFATSLAASFVEARRIALGENARLRQRAAALNALEGCARAFALRLWGPMLATRPVGEPIDEPDLGETWKLVASAPAQILDLIKERRQLGQVDADADLPLEILAIRLGGYALDACGESSDLGPGRGPTAHNTCLWLRKIAGLADGSRDLPPGLKSALSALFWRLVDTTRGTALGEVDDVEWLGPFAAWWALVIDRPAMLLQLATALPMMADGALALCCERAESLRTAVSSGSGDGEWGTAASQALESLHALNTELSQALIGLADALLSFNSAAGPKPNLEAMCLELVIAGERLQGALADPVKALHASEEDVEQGARARSPFSIAPGSPLSIAPRSPTENPPRAPLSNAPRSPTENPPRGPSENASRIAALVARAIRARELSLLDVWFASLGPVASALLEGAVRSAIRRTPPPPPKAKKQEPKVIHGYELVKTLGEGGIGSVWLVRKPGADRLFVLKIPKAEALANATDSEREGILASFVEEARALAGLYHPNVANIIDRGVEGGMPFLVLEYLIGADLKEYAGAQPMSLLELRQVVLDSCAGLAALHSAGLVHRDIKPANIWLRLPLSGGERFDAQKHRDPARTQPLSAVVIDFGMVRAIRVPAEASGRFVAGTAGYIAPEQVLDPVELDPRSDVYSLAGTIYNVSTGRAFFDEIDNARDRIIAHMRRDPFEDAERLRVFPTAVAKVLRAATLLEPAHRPTPLEFGKEFAAAL